MTTKWIAWTPTTRKKKGSLENKRLFTAEQVHLLQKEGNAGPDVLGKRVEWVFLPHETRPGVWIRDSDHYRIGPYVCFYSRDKKALEYPLPPPKEKKRQVVSTTSFEPQLKEKEEIQLKENIYYVPPFQGKTKVYEFPVFHPSELKIPKKFTIQWQKPSTKEGAMTLLTSLYKDSEEHQAWTASRQIHFLPNWSFDWTGDIEFDPLFLVVHPASMQPNPEVVASWPRNQDTLTTQRAIQKQFSLFQSRPSSAQITPQVTLQCS